MMLDSDASKILLYQKYDRNRNSSFLLLHRPPFAGKIPIATGINFFLWAQKVTYQTKLHIMLSPRVIIALFPYENRDCSE